MPNWQTWRRQGLMWVLLCAAISVAWGTQIAAGGNAWIDFRAVYAGTRCLMHGHNPYNVGDLAREYGSEDGPRPPATPLHIQSITLYVNMPTTFMIVAPFAALAYGPATVLWMLATGGAFVLALLLMWRLGARYAPRVSTFLICILAINCESIFAGANTAGIVVGLCAIAVWCFLENRFVRVGVVCLALCLAVKPHDAGLIWLYFLLAGGVQRKRALQSLLITVLIGLAAAGWVSHVAPTWMHDWKANLATISAPGGINEPGPSAVKDGSVYSIVDLQGALSIFRDNPQFYNRATYAICGLFLLAWAVWTLRAGFSEDKAWLALSVATAFSMLVTYHRIWDAKLAMLVIPACCMVWARRDRTGKAAFLVTASALFVNGDISLVILAAIVKSFPPSVSGMLGPVVACVTSRPASVALLVLGVFYLGLYARHALAPRSVAPVVAELEHVSL